VGGEPSRTVYFLDFLTGFFGGDFFACTKSLAATSRAAGGLDALRRIFDAFEAADFPVVMLFSTFPCIQRSRLMGLI
jgi:hypothetical protein